MFFHMCTLELPMKMEKLVFSHYAKLLIKLQTSNNLNTNPKITPMTKFKSKAELFEYLKQLDPLSAFETEFGFLKLSDEQKEIIRQMRFTPGKHIFAYIAGPDGIKCLEFSEDHPNAFEKFVDKHERSSLAYTYLGVSDEKGCVEIKK